MKKTKLKIYTADLDIGGLSSEQLRSLQTQIANENEFRSLEEDERKVNELNKLRDELRKIPREEIWKITDIIDKLISLSCISEQHAIRDFVMAVVDWDSFEGDVRLKVFEASNGYWDNKDKPEYLAWKEKRMEGDSK